MSPFVAPVRVISLCSPQKSSLQVMEVLLFGQPGQIATLVSIDESQVFSVAEPFAGAVQRYQRSLSIPVCPKKSQLVSP